MIDAARRVGASDIEELALAAGARVSRIRVDEPDPVFFETPVPSVAAA